MFAVVFRVERVKDFVVLFLERVDERVEVLFVDIDRDIIGRLTVINDEFFRVTEKGDAGDFLHLDFASDKSRSDGEVFVVDLVCGRAKNGNNNDDARKSDDGGKAGRRIVFRHLNFGGAQIDESLYVERKANRRRAKPRDEHYDRERRKLILESFHKTLDTLFYAYIIPSPRDFYKEKSNIRTFSVKKNLTKTGYKSIMKDIA